MTGREIAELKMEIVKILQPREKVLQGLKRLGGKQQQRGAQSGGKSSRFSKVCTMIWNSHGLASADSGGFLARVQSTSSILPENKAAFDKLTEASSVLQDSGEYNIYNDTKEDLERDCSAFLATSAARDKLLDGDVEDDMFADSDDEKDGAKAKEPTTEAKAAGTSSEVGGADSKSSSDFVYDEQSGYYYSSSLGLF